MSVRKIKGTKKAEQPIAPLKAAPGIPQLVQLYTAYAEQLRIHAEYTSPPQATYSTAVLSTNVRIK